jgi:16S rRNA (cytosine1402-N4)-methyltransferase
MTPQPSVTGDHHVSVLRDEVVHALTEALPADEAPLFLDATFGVGGHTTALLESTKAHVYALDRDPEAALRAERLAQSYPGRFTFRPGRLGEMEAVFHELKGQCQGILMDIGVSSPQLDMPERGFSFRFDGPLDMRMNPQEGLTAADIVNTYGASDLARIFKEWGEERFARPIAHAIVTQRVESPFHTTTQLRTLIHRIIPPRGDKIDPATRVFQALRIAVNEELEELKKGMEQSLRLLAPGGRVAIISFHSLEDRLVKNFFNDHGRPAPVNRHAPMAATPPQHYRVITRKPMTPSPAEQSQNPRSRSAKLRILEAKRSSWDA